LQWRGQRMHSCNDESLLGKGCGVNALPVPTTTRNSAQSAYIPGHCTPPVFSPRLPSLSLRYLTSTYKSHRYHSTATEYISASPEFCYLMASGGKTPRSVDEKVFCREGRTMRPRVNRSGGCMGRRHSSASSSVE